MSTFANQFILTKVKFLLKIFEKGCFQNKVKAFILIFS